MTWLQRLRQLLADGAWRTRDLAEQQRELKADVALTRREIEVQARYYRMHQRGGR